MTQKVNIDIIYIDIFLERYKKRETQYAINLGGHYIMGYFVVSL